MKTAFLILGALASHLYGEVKSGGVPFRDAATDDSLTEQFRKVSLQDPMKKFPESKGEDATVVNHVGNLIENSELITFNGQTTLVPKNAIITIPEMYANRVNHHQQGAKIVSWLDFLSRNRGWISTVEVTLSQARGEKPLATDMGSLSKSKNLVVAVMKGGPISVLPPKVEKPVAEPNQNEQVKP